LSQALNVLEAQDDPDPLAVAKVLRDMGDWQVAFSKTGSGEEQYVRAWELLGRVDNGDRLRKEWFSGPEYVLREPVSQRGVDNGPGSQDGYVLVRFDVDERGRTANVEVLKSEPEGLKDEAVLRAVQRSRFRPQMDGGEVVPGKGLALRFTFRYMPDEKKN
jgi:TonB family protein